MCASVRCAGKKVPHMLPGHSEPTLASPLGTEALEGEGVI